jgi:S1-C subfamily serine protease
MSLAAITLAAITLGALAAGCADDGPAAAVDAARRSVVTVESQTCMDPNPRHGMGVVTGDGIVVTAGHVVEGDLRRLTVDGVPASVIALDRNADLAALAVDGLDAPALSLTALEPDHLALVGTASASRVDVTSRELLVLEHATDRAVYRRRVIAFRPGVTEGASGSPLVDAAGRLAGIVVLVDDDSGEGIAVAASELAELLGTSAGPERGVRALQYC